jgi:methanogenic corrinoid protein MtbC1
LTPCTGEQHSFSVQVLDVFFSNAGWQVETRLSYNGRAIEAVIKKRHLDIVGLSVSRESLLEQIASDIESIRCKSCNPNLIVLVGGGFFAEHPELVSRVGADATASDARSAVALADRLVPERATVKR